MVPHPRNLIVPGVAGIVFSAGVAFAQCPTSTLECVICAPSCGVAQSSSTQQSAGSLFCPGSGSSMSFNLGSGTFQVASQGGSNYAGGGTLTTRDLYAVTGPPAGTDLTVLAKLTVASNTASGCGLDVAPSTTNFASLTVGASTSSASASSIWLGCTPFGGPGSFLCCSDPGTMNSPIVLSIPCVAGQPFEMKIVLDSRSSVSSGSLSATLAFEDLPANGSITSCNGFSQGGPVPVNAISWGRLKQIYR
jgi:hypothetical protein